MKAPIVVIDTWVMWALVCGGLVFGRALYDFLKYLVQP